VFLAHTQEGTPTQRNQDDAAKLAQKVAAKQAKMKEQEEQQAVSSAAPVAKPKKKVAAAAGLDDLLSAGLTKNKGKK